MGIHNAGYILSAPAKADWQQTIKTGVECWGLIQAHRYIEQIANTLALLVQHPNIGRQRLDLFEGVQCFPVGSHVIYYRYKPDCFEVCGFCINGWMPDAHRGKQTF